MLVRTWRSRVASSVWIAVAGAAAAGCGGDDGAQPTDAASIDARIDAAVDARTVDAPVDATPIDADISMCAIAGVYTADLGKEVFFRFDGDTHAWGAALTEAELAMPLLHGTYTYASTSFTIVEAPKSSCPADQTGKYTVAFAGACDFTLTLVEDPCVGRAESLDGATFMFVHP